MEQTPCSTQRAPTLPHSTVPTSQMATITQAEPVLSIKVTGTSSLSVPSASLHHLFCPRQRGAQSRLPRLRAGTGHGLLLTSLGTKHQKVSTLTRSEKYTSVRMVKYWNRTPRVVVDALNLETSQLGWGSEQCGLAEGVPARCRGLDWMDFKGLLQYKPLCDSMICCFRSQS